jgi:hypothetical protein
VLRPRQEQSRRVACASAAEHARACAPHRPRHTARRRPRTAGCAPLYRVPQTQWTPKLFWQMAVYVTWILASMAAGGLLPRYLDGPAMGSIADGWKYLESLPPSNYTYCQNTPPYTYREFTPWLLRGQGRQSRGGEGGRAAAWYPQQQRHHGRGCAGRPGSLAALTRPCLPPNRSAAAARLPAAAASAQW